MMRKFAFALGVTTCCSQVHSAYAVKNTNVLDDMPRGSIRKNVFDRSGVLHESRVRNNLLKPEMIPHNFPLFLKMTFPKLIADLKKLNKPKNKKLSRSSSSKISFNHNTPLANKKSIKRKIRAKAKEERKKKRKAALAAKKKRITKIRLKKQKEIKKINERVSRKKARANYIRTKKNRVSRKKTTLDNNIDMRVLLSTLRKKGMLASLFKPHTTHSNPPKSKVSDQKNSPQSLNRRIPHEKKPQNSSKLAAKSTSEVKRITLPTKPLETPFKETRKSVSSVPSPIKKVDQEKQGTISPSKLPKIVKTPTQIQPAFKAMTQIKALKEAIKELEKTSSVCDLDMTNKTRSYLKGTKNLNSSNLAHTLASLYESEQVITRQQVAIENLEPGPLAKQPTVFDITPEPTLAINEEAIPTLKKTSPPETPQVIVSSNDHVLSKQITGLYFQNPNIDLETAETSNYLIQTPPKVSWENDSIEKDIASIQRTDLETSPPSQEDKASSRDHVVIANLESIPQEKSTFHVVAKVFDNLTPITKISTLTAPNRTHEQKSREEKGTPIAESIPSITKENDFKEAVMSLVHESSMDELKIIAENSSQFTSNDEIESKAKIIKYSTHNAQTNKRPDTSNMALKIGEELIPSVSSVVSELVGIERTWIEEGIVRIGTHVKPTEPQDIEFHRVIVQPEKGIKTVIPSSSIEPIHTATDELIDEKHTIVDSDLKAAAIQPCGEMQSTPLRPEPSIHAKEENFSLESAVTELYVFPTAEIIPEPIENTEILIHGKKGRDEQQILSSAVPLAINIERTWIEEGIARIGTHVKPTEPQDIEFHRVIVQPEKAIKTVIPSSSIEPIHTATDELIDEKHTIVDSDLKAAAIQPCGEMQSTPLRPEPSMHAKEENFSLESAGTELYVFPTIEIIPEPIESPEILIHGKKGRDEQQILTSAAPLAINIERTWIEEGIARIGTDVKPTEPQDIEFHRVIVQPEKAIKTIIPSSSIEPIHTVTDELIDEKHTIVDSDLKAAATQSFGEMHDASVELEYATHSRETNSILEGVDTKKLAFPNTEDLLEEVGSGLEATIHSEDTYVLQAVAGQVSSLRKSTLMTNPDESAQSLNIILSNTSLEPMDAIAIAPVIDIQQPGSLDTSASLIAPEPADYEGSIQTEEGRELQPVSEQTHVLTEAIHLTESHISPLSAEPNTPVEAASHIEKLSEEPEKDITKSKIEKFINALSTLNSSLGNLIQKISSLDPIESNPKSGNPLFIISFCLNLINTLLDKTSITLEITDLNKSTYSEQNEGTFLTQLETLKEKLDHFISLFGTVDRQKLNVETLERMRKATNLSLHISPKVLEFNVEDYLSRMERLGKLTTGVLSPEAQSNALAQTPVEAATSVSATLFQDSDGAPPKEIESETPTSHIKQPIAIQKIDSIKDNVETFMNELSTLNAGLNSFIQKVASLSPIEANPTLISPFYVINFTLNLINASLNEINKNLGIQILKEENGLDQKEETYLGALEIFRQKMAQFISDFNAVDQLRLDTTILKEMKKIKSLSSYVSSKLLEFKIEEYLSKKPQLIENVSKTKEIVLKTSAAELLSTTERLENILDNFVFKDEDFYKLDTYIQKSIPFILSQIFFFKNTLTYIQRKDNSLLKTYLRETKEDKLRYETLQAEGATLQIKLGAFRSGLDLLRQRLSNFKDVLEDFDFSHLDIIAICNLNSLRSTIEYLVTMVTSIKEKLGTSSASPVWPAAPVVALQEWLNKKVISTTSHNADDDQARTLPPNSVEEAISNTLDSASVPRSDVIPSTIEGEATTVITPPAAAQEPEADPGSVRGEGRVDGDDVVPLLSDLSVSSSPPLTGESEKTRLSPLHDEGIVSSSEHTFSSRKHIELEPLVGQQDDKIQAQEKARRLLEKMINLAMSPSLVTPVSDAGVEELTQLAFFSGDLRQLMDNALEQDEMPTTLIERAPSLEYAAFRPEMKILTQKLVALLKNYSFAKNRRCSLSTKLCYMSYLSNLTTIQLRLEAHPTINHDPFMLQEDELPISDKNLPKKKSSFLPISSTSLLTEGMLAKVGTPAAPNDEGAENRENGRLNPSFLPLRASGKGTDIMPKVFTHQSHPQGRLPRTPLGAFKPNTGPK